MSQQLSPEIVTSIYQALLGRLPESEDIIRRACNSGHSLEGFLRETLRSREFILKWKRDMPHSPPDGLTFDVRDKSNDPANRAQRIPQAECGAQEIEHLLRKAQVSEHLGMPGFELPELSRFERLVVSTETKSHLAQHGINIEGDFGKNNIILLESTTTNLNVTLRFFGCADATILFEGGCQLKNNSIFYFFGSHNTAVVRASQGSARLVVQMRGSEGLFFFGKNATTNFTDCLVQGPAAVVVGEDSMFAEGTVIRSFDSHAVIDAVSGAQLNRPESVRIGRHVWLGFHAMVMPGVDIGNGSIVGAGAIVTKSVPPRTSAGGVPARQIRQNVSWTREETPNTDQTKRALEWSE